MKAVVLKVKPPYNFTDENTGRKIMGFKITYIPLGMAREAGAFGVPFVIDKTVSDIVQHDVFKQNPVPGVYEIHVRQSYNSKNQLIEVITGVDFDRKIILDDLIKL